MNIRSPFILSVALACFFSLKLENSLGQSPGFAVVELFTSEGCSSCPAAEDVVMDIAEENNKDIYILEFHVDYWDRLGWKDPFSSAAYSERQQEYAQKMGLRSVYTPQAIVNGSTEMVGSDKNRLQKTINAELPKNQPGAISIQTQKSEPHSVTVSYTIHHKSNDLLNIALLQTEADTDVKRGENKGRQLHHIQIVREFKTIESPNESGSISFTLPADLTTKKIQVIAYLQDKINLNIRGAVQSKALN